MKNEYPKTLFYITYGMYGENGKIKKYRHWGKVAGDFHTHRTVFGYNMNRLKMWFVRRWWDFQHRDDPDWGEGGG